MAVNNVIISHPDIENEEKKVTLNRLIREWEVITDTYEGDISVFEEERSATINQLRGLLWNSKAVILWEDSTKLLGLICDLEELTLAVGVLKDAGSSGNREISRTARNALIALTVNPQQKIRNIARSALRSLTELHSHADSLIELAI